MVGLPLWLSVLVSAKPPLLTMRSCFSVKLPFRGRGPGKLIQPQNDTLKV